MEEWNKESSKENITGTDNDGITKETERGRRGVMDGVKKREIMGERVKRQKWRVFKEEEGNLVWR